jgi:predicted enzyme related to lactoylglutathione lyase
VTSAEPSVERLGHLLLQVRDLGAAERFYVEVLGFRVKKRERFRDGRPLVVTEQGLGLTDGRPAGDGANVDHIAFHVHSLAALLSRVREAGASVVRGPSTNPYGYAAYVADPDGNEVELIAPAEESGDA